MRRKRMLVFAAFVALLISVAAVYGGGWLPSVVIGDSLTVAGEGYGLGKVDQASIEATLQGSLVCVNKGGNTAPGQNRFEVTLNATQDVVVRNGKFSFSFFFPDEALGFSPSDPRAAGCPNGNWSVDYMHDRLTFTLREIENGVPVARTAATYNCIMSPPALSGSYVCSPQ